LPVVWRVVGAVFVYVESAGLFELVSVVQKMDVVGWVVGSGPF